MGSCPRKGPLLSPQAAGFCFPWPTRTAAGERWPILSMEQPFRRRIEGGRIDGCTLPKFYFDTFDGDQTAIDADGIDCASRQMVQDRAVDALPDMARELLPDGPNRTFRVDVRDDSGDIVFRATLELNSTWLDGNDC